MNDLLPVLARSALFEGVPDRDIAAMLSCLAPRRAAFARGEAILEAGATTRAIGVLTSGAALISQEDFWGNRNILARLEPGDLFAEVFACLDGLPLSASVIAEAPAAALFLDVRRVMTTCSSACTFHSRIIRNLMTGMARKNAQLNEKLTHLSQRSTREKLLSYLSAQARRAGKSDFELPFNRQQLADYLSVDRSALSAELGRLKREGVLDFDRAHFHLCGGEAQR